MDDVLRNQSYRALTAREVGTCNRLQKGTLRKMITTTPFGNALERATDSSSLITRSPPSKG